MSVEVQSDEPHSSMALQGENGFLVDKEQSTDVVAEGHVTKWKPYTITKQRERWSEEEHKRFLEALKLYGRAWRKIEEHVGTKTAVQIRSHAQKFFSKVVRETTSSSSVEPIEIPPPRPKKKPSHPYPRKLVVSPARKETVEDEEQQQPARCVSPVSSSVNRDNQSPTSVLCAAVVSDSEPDRSSSPVEEEDSNVSPHQPDEPISLKLELFPNIETCETRKCLKLFGKTVPVREDDDDDDDDSSLLKEQFQVSRHSPSSSLLGSTTSSACGVVPALCYISASPIPIWAMYGGLPYPFNDHLATRSLATEEGTRHEYLQNEPSAPASVNVPWNLDAEGRSDLNTKSSNNLEAAGRGRSGENCKRGFVPYKRCLSAREAQSSTMASGSEEKERPRTRLCL